MTNARHIRKLFEESRAATALEYGVAGGILALLLGSVFIHVGGKIGFALAALGHSLNTWRPAH